MADAGSTTETSSERAGVSRTVARLGKKIPWRLILAGGAVTMFVLLAIFGPMVLDYDPVQTRNADRLLPPGSTLSNGETAWLGTDQSGRSVFAQVVEGARISMLVAAGTIFIGGTVGLIVGIVAGYFGGAVDSVAMRIADVQLAFPSILLAILIAGVLGPSVLNVIITLAITRWVLFARVVRGSTLATKGRDFVDSARVIGAPDLRILQKYIFPSTLTPLLIIATAQVGLMIIAEASLSFLGLGVPLNQPSWGSIIANGRNYLGTAWWIATMPGIALVMVVVSVGFLSDELRDRLDPNLDVDVR